MLTQDQATICALSTPPGSGAIALIRLSGKKVFPILAGIFSRDIQEVSSHTAHFGKIQEGTEVIDECLVTIFRAPTSFTGEDVAEIACHGSPYIQQRLLQLLQQKGARLAEPGEYTLRAFFNGKMDLSQAEAVADLVASGSKAAHDLAMHQMRGGFSRDIAQLRQELVDLASLIELELDFSEEDVEFADREKLTSTVSDILKKLRRLVDSFSVGNVLKKGVPVAIIGMPNVGKSTLLNALMKEDRAIVSDIAGTTRDAIEDEIDIRGVSFRFIDTAGIRETPDKIEAMGVERTFENIRKASVVLYMVDPLENSKEDVQQFLTTFQEQHADNEKKLVLVINKSDQDPEAARRFEELPRAGVPVVSISARDHQNLEALEEQLLSYIDQGTLSGQDTVITNARHHQALSQACEALERVQDGMNNELTGDMLALDIRNALHHLGEITGEVTTDELLGNIFSNFCIGK